MNTSVIFCFTVCIAIVIATKSCCLPIEYEGQLLISSQSRVQGSLHKNMELLNVAQHYKKSLSVIKQNSSIGLVHILVDYNGYTYVSVNGTCLSKEKTTSKPSPRCSICNKGHHIGSAYLGAEDNKLLFDTYNLKYKTYTNILGVELKDLKIMACVTEVEDDDVIVPISEMGECTINGVHINFQETYVNLKIGIEEDDVFDVPSACQQNQMMFRNGYPKLMNGFKRNTLQNILPKETQHAINFISIV